jgi:hypothetical protein
VYVVEFYDDRDSAFFQVGAFYSEAQAQALLDQWVAEGGMNDQIRINTIPVHRHLEDWNYDR